MGGGKNGEYTEGLGLGYNKLPTRVERAAPIASVKSIVISIEGLASCRYQVKICHQWQGRVEPLLSGVNAV